MTPEHRANLAKLATHLEKLPLDYDMFGMAIFHTENLGNVVPKKKAECGTVACAVGHGPWAGIKTRRDDPSWEGYCERVFGVDIFSGSGAFMFGGEWADYDDTHRGAAARIRFVLADKYIPGMRYYGQEPSVYAEYLV